MSAKYIAAHLVYLRAAGRSERTVIDREQLLHRIDDDLPHGLIRAATRELAAWLGHPGWARWTLCTYHMHLRGFFRWATSGHDPWLDWDPMSDLPQPPRPRRVPNPVSNAELARAVAGSRGLWLPVILLAAFAGLRASEIAQLRREDVSATVVRVLGKGDRVAAVPTHPLIWASVRDLPPGPLIVTGNGLQASGRWLSAKARGHFDRLGLPGVHLHRLRHWFGTMIQEQGGDLRLTQELMRHASPTTTAGYAEVAGERRRQAVLALPTPDGVAGAAADAGSSAAGADAASS